MEAIAKETSWANTSLPLHEVLESEFLALHGKLPADYPHSAEPETRLKAFCAAVHGLKEKHAALCMSGGGIRSATFGLGILQGLARCGLLDKFHYLSTVGGGGYIGSWLSAWIKRQGIKGVIAGLASPAPTKEPPTNTPQGNGGVVPELAESKRPPDSSLDPEPLPIRELRAYCNYRAPKTGLTSVDFWAVIAAYFRDILLNWLVLVSWLAAAMMIPRLYLAVVNISPNWSTWTPSVGRHWDIGLRILLTIAFALIAIATAYVIIDVPSTGNARLSQSRFLKFRQLPLLLASLILAAWWALFRNVHGSEPFQPREWLPKFVGFWFAGYLSGGVLAWVSLSFRKPEQKARPGRFIDSVLRLSTIVLTAAFAGECLWAMGMRLFLFPSETEFVLKRDCETIQIANQKEKLWYRTPPYPSFKLPAGTRCFKTSGSASCPESSLPGASLAEDEFVLREDFKAIEIPSGQKTTIPACTHVHFAGENLTALQAVLVPAPARHALNYVCFAPALILVVLLLVDFIFTGLASWVTEDADREWWGRAAAWSLITISGWIIFNVIVLLGTHALEVTPGTDFSVTLKELNENPVAKTVLAAFGGVTGIVTALLALRTKLTKKFGAGVHWSLLIAATAFFVLLAIIVSWVALLPGARPQVRVVAGTFFGEKHYISQQFAPFFLAASTLIFGIVMGFFINTNKFSLLSIYRNRLIRAYLAALRNVRRPYLFTDFDPDDNFALHKLPSGKPLHVINAALDLVIGAQLAWQARRAVSFTMSRLHCGSFKLGYRPSDGYGSEITLGTAMAISGAAANPNIGFHSSPLVRVLMTLFNGRLGCWLGNPGPSGAKTWRRAGPRYFVGLLCSEIIGNTTDCYEYVNLFDGGHFENLGLYEMVLRRCHFIVVIDASEDPECSFADLGEAIRKIRIDFGIPIEFETMTIYPRSQIDSLKKRGKTCAIGRIRYSEVDSDVDGKKVPDGIIIYIKPACYGEEPRDVYEYFKRSGTFPHESTADQFFSESQFESYRMLGLYTMQNLCEKSVKDFPDFIEEIQKHLTV